MTLSAKGVLLAAILVVMAPGGANAKSKTLTLTADRTNAQARAIQASCANIKTNRQDCIQAKLLAIQLREALQSRYSKQQ